MLAIIYISLKTINWTWVNNIWWQTVPWYYSTITTTIQYRESLNTLHGFRSRNILTRFRKLPGTCFCFCYVDIAAKQARLQWFVADRKKSDALLPASYRHSRFWTILSFNIKHCDEILMKVPSWKAAGNSPGTFFLFCMSTYFILLLFLFI